MNNELTAAHTDGGDAEHAQDQLNLRLPPPTKPIQRARPKVDAYEGGNEWVNFAVASSRGYRSDMQDMHAVHLDLKSADNGSTTALFAVFDGHGGSDVAKFCADAVAETLQRTLAFATPGAPMTTAVKECMLLLDEEVLKRFPKRQGSTATLALLRNGELAVGGVGDSRCILARDGKPVVLTIDHKPTHPKEEQRIRQAGGFVAMGRVGADLNVSRAIGDGQYKENDSLPAEAQMVSPEPDICQLQLDERDHWLLVASDGLWNSLKETEIIKYIYKHLQEDRSLASIAKGLTQACNSPSKSAGDNITVCIVRPTKLPVKDGSAAASQHGDPIAVPMPHSPSAPALPGAGADAPGGHAVGKGSGREPGLVQGQGVELPGAEAEAAGKVPAQEAGLIQGPGVKLAMAPGQQVAGGAAVLGGEGGQAGAEQGHEASHATTAAKQTSAGLVAGATPATDGPVTWHSSVQQHEQARLAPLGAAAAAKAVAAEPAAPGPVSEAIDGGVSNSSRTGSAAAAAPASTTRSSSSYFQTL